MNLKGCYSNAPQRTAAMHRNFNELKTKTMDITAEKYYDENLENYNLLNKIDPMTAKQAMRIMEEYHQAKLKLLGIGDVSQQRELLKAFQAIESKEKEIDLKKLKDKEIDKFIEAFNCG